MKTFILPKNPLFAFLLIFLGIIFLSYLFKNFIDEGFIGKAARTKSEYLTFSGNALSPTLSTYRP
jgi:hypothetical protein